VRGVEVHIGISDMSLSSGRCNRTGQAQAWQHPTVFVPHHMPLAAGPSSIVLHIIIVGPKTPRFTST
jgi:small neutral amino acid transporter SnatA (MarC family)